MRIYDTWHTTYSSWKTFIWGLPLVQGWILFPSLTRVTNYFYLTQCKFAKTDELRHQMWPSPVLVLKHATSHRPESKANWCVLRSCHIWTETEFLANDIGVVKMKTFGPSVSISGRFKQLLVNTFYSKQPFFILIRHYFFPGFFAFDVVYMLWVL